MSGISPSHNNKFISCRNCPDRTIEPVNCHSVCKGYLYRKSIDEQNYKNRLKSNTLSTDLTVVRHDNYVRRMRNK